MWENEKRKEYMKKYAKENKEKKKKLGIWKRSRGKRVESRKRWDLKHPERVKAYNKINFALRKGKIKRPEICSICGNAGFIMGHHYDYSKPLDVIWVCWICHNKIHGDK